MKKKIVFSFIALMTIGIFACNKNKNSTTNTELAKHEAALAQIQKIRTSAATYKNDHMGLKTTATNGATVKAVVADCMGCWAGCKVGVKVGAALGNPVTGAAAGAVLGAIVGSGWSLWCSWNNDVVPLVPPTVPSWASTYYGANAECGYIHNSAMVSMFSNGSSSGYSTTPRGFFTSSLSAASTYVADAFGISPSLLYSIADTTDTAAVNGFLANCSTMTVSQDASFISYEVNADANIVTYMTDFLNDFTGCDPSDTSDMFAFCSAYISAISSDNTLTSTEMNNLLTSINVAQYSLSLWTTNANEFE